MMKHKLGRKGVIQLTLLRRSLSLKEVRSELKEGQKACSQRQELMQRPWGSAAYWFVPCGLLRLLSYRIKDHYTLDGITPNGLNPPLLTISYKNTDGSHGEIFSVGITSLQMTIAWVKYWRPTLTKLVHSRVGMWGLKSLSKRNRGLREIKGRNTDSIGSYIWWILNPPLLFSTGFYT